MNNLKFYSAGCTDALADAIKTLKQKGCLFAQQPDDTVTHVLLDVPSFAADGLLKDGSNLTRILQSLPQEVTVFGGNLQHTALNNYKTVDLLQDNIYLADNARITAYCAVQRAMDHLPVTLWGCHVLVVGWGRIGKCLAALLKNMGAYVTVAVRKEADRAILQALGYDTAAIETLGYSLLRYRVIFNTVPVMVLPQETMQYCSADCLKIDLASQPGMEGTNIIWARGLPSQDAAESSGQLIAQTVLRLR